MRQYTTFEKQQRPSWGFPIPIHASTQQTLIRDMLEIHTGLWMPFQLNLSVLLHCDSFVSHDSIMFLPNQAKHQGYINSASVLRDSLLQNSQSTAFCCCSISLPTRFRPDARSFLSRITETSSCTDKYSCSLSCATGTQFQPYIVKPLSSTRYVVLLQILQRLFK